MIEKDKLDFLRDQSQTRKDYNVSTIEDEITLALIKDYIAAQQCIRLIDEQAKGTPVKGILKSYYNGRL